MRPSVRSWPLSVLLLTTSAQAQDMAPPEEKAPRLLQIAGQGAGSWSTGNTRSWILNAALRTSLRLGPNQWTMSGIYTYSAATTAPSGAPPDAPAEHYVADSNLYGRARYDRSFLGMKNAVFVGMLAFRDTSSGFAARYMPYVGYERILLHKPKLGELWVEGGYRLAYESLDRDPAALREGLPATRWVHGPTAFVGGKLELSETTNLEVGVEALEDVRQWRDLRINTFASATSYVARGFSFGLSWNSRWLWEPIGDRVPLDTSLQAVLISQLDIDL